MKLSSEIYRSIQRLKSPDNQRITQNLKEAAEQVGCFLATLAQGHLEFTSYYKAQVLYTHNEAAKAYLVVDRRGSPRRAIVASEKPLWDLQGAVLSAGQEEIKNFIQDVSTGFVERSLRILGKLYNERLRDMQRLLGAEQKHPMRRAEDKEAEPVHG